MGTKHIHNPGKNIMFVGGKMIPPGEGKDIDEALLPPEHRDAPAEEAPRTPSLDEALAEELKKPVAELIEGLGRLTQEALERMGTLEGEAKKPRKSLLEAIGAEKVKRADEALQKERLAEGLKRPVEELIAALDSLTVAELDIVAELESASAPPRMELIDAIAAEKAKRAGD